MKETQLLKEIAQGTCPQSILYPAFILRDWLHYNGRIEEARSVQRLLDVYATDVNDVPVTIGNHRGEKKRVLKARLAADGSITWKDNYNTKLTIPKERSILYTTDLLINFSLGRCGSAASLGESRIIGPSLSVIWIPAKNDEYSNPNSNPEWILQKERIEQERLEFAITAAAKIMLCFKPNLGSVPTL